MFGKQQKFALEMMALALASPTLFNRDARLGKCRSYKPKDIQKAIHRALDVTYDILDRTPETQLPSDLREAAMEIARESPVVVEGELVYRFPSWVGDEF